MPFKKGPLFRAHHAADGAEELLFAPLDNVLYLLRLHAVDLVGGVEGDELVLVHSAISDGSTDCEKVYS